MSANGAQASDDSSWLLVLTGSAAGRSANFTRSAVSASHTCPGSRLASGGYHMAYPSFAKPRWTAGMLWAQPAAIDTSAMASTVHALRQPWTRLKRWKREQDSDNCGLPQWRI